MKRNNGETVPEFTSIFCKLYHRRQSSLLKLLAAMVAYAASFEVEFALHLRERRSHDLEALFNDAEDLESNMRASGIALKTKQDPPYRREYAEIRRRKEPEVSTSAGQDPMTLEEVTKLLKTMANDLTKVK